MYFHFSKSVTILFEGWSVNDATGKLISDLHIFALGAETLGYNAICEA